MCAHHCTAIFQPCPHCVFFQIPLSFFLGFGSKTKKCDHPPSLALIQLPQKRIDQTCKLIKVHIK